MKENMTSFGSNIEWIFLNVIYNRVCKHYLRQFHCVPLVPILAFTVKPGECVENYQILKD